MQQPNNKISQKTKFVNVVDPLLLHAGWGMGTAQLAGKNNIFFKT